MEDSHYAGGIPAVLNQLLPLLHGDALTSPDARSRKMSAARDIIQPDVIRTLDDPYFAEGGLAILRGNLASDGG